jgi:hypothetical protein
VFIRGSLSVACDWSVVFIGGKFVNDIGLVCCVYRGKFVKDLRLVCCVYQGKFVSNLWLVCCVYRASLL